jgi:hypothetical protein
MRNAKSLETTHGLIRAQSNAPFMFVSGITDRVGSFHDEVDPAFLRSEHSRRAQRRHRRCLDASKHRQLPVKVKP